MSLERKYFESELNSLNTEAKEFSREYPDVASKLNLDEPEDKDPQVERLFEGFSFIAGKIQQRIDDDYPILSEGFLETVAPEFLRPLPSICMMEFSPRKGMLTNSYTVKKGVSVYSREVGPDNIKCEFQTTKDIAVFPMQVAKVDQVQDAVLGTGIEFHFSFDKGCDLSTHTDSSFSLYVAGEKKSALELISLLTSEENQIELKLNGILQNTSKTNSLQVVRGGMNLEESPFSESEISMGRSLSLFEFFNSPDKFRYLDFRGIEKQKLAEDIMNISISVYFEKKVEGLPHKYHDIFKLFVAPAINLF